MDKVRQQKINQFLVEIDTGIKAMKDYLALENGDVLLEKISKWEEENAEFLQHYPEKQDDLNKRKTAIDFILFPIISDDKVDELLQYHALDALNLGLDLEELMKMRAITTSELLWSQLSQRYIKALMQNTQLIGSRPIIVDGGRNSFLPYVKNWINLYTRRFGVEKHTGLEPHQFVLDNPNAQNLNKGAKESLLKILKFYEGMKVYSLSEIESEIRKMAPMPPKEQPKQQKNSPQNPRPNPLTEKVNTPKKLAPSPIQNKISVQAKYDEPALETSSPQENPKTVVENSEMPRSDAATREMGHILALVEKYPDLNGYKLTSSPISILKAPFSLEPTIKNWINYYFEEQGKGRHNLEERGAFLKLVTARQGLSPADLENLKQLLRSVDDKTTLPYDVSHNKLLFESMGVGTKIKFGSSQDKEENTSKTVQKQEEKKKNKIRVGNYDLDLELVPVAKIEPEEGRLGK